jgi:putative peptide zinc metalloprotease protein
MTRIAAALLVIALALVLGTARATPAHGQDNTAVAVNTKDGAEIFRLAFKIVRANQEIIDQSNAAVAFNSCTECTSIAIAFQIVLIFSDPDVVTSENIALAINWDCDACVAFASAYQWLLTTGGPVHFSAEGNERLAELRRQLRELLQSDLTLEQLAAELDRVKNEIADILANELVPAGAPSDSGGTGTETETETTATTTAPPETTTATTTEGSTTTAP